jgi:hypothetical protein
VAAQQRGGGATTIRGGSVCPSMWESIGECGSPILFKAGPRWPAGCRPSVLLQAGPRQQRARCAPQRWLLQTGSKHQSAPMSSNVMGRGGGPRRGPPGRIMVTSFFYLLFWVFFLDFLFKSLLVLIFLQNFSRIFFLDVFFQKLFPL